MLKASKGRTLSPFAMLTRTFWRRWVAGFPKPRNSATIAKCSMRCTKRLTPWWSARPIIRTPLPSLIAMRLGKHVYCEKPLTWSIEEARLMAATAKQYKVATQMGTQGMASDNSRAGIEVIRSGVLGEVRELHVWTDRATTWWPQGVERPTDTPAVPKTLDWDLWLGGAQERPYHPAYVPFKWRGWKDFGTGAIGDMGIHNAAMPLAALQLGVPESVEIMETSGLKGETYPTWSTFALRVSGKGRPKSGGALLV